MPDFQANRRGLEQLLSLPGVRADLERRATRVQATAKATAPVETGKLRDGIKVVNDVEPTGRARSRVVAPVPYAAEVTSTNHFLAKALDTGR